MLHYVKGDILKAQVKAIVNPVNCVGVMGKGLALQFKEAYPDNYSHYKKVCNNGKLNLGEILVYTFPEKPLLPKYPTEPLLPKYIINFPTKHHWQDRSYISDIETGLLALVRFVKLVGIKSIAIPPLGCGLGGLEWEEVKPLIESKFKNLLNLEVYIYEK